MFLEQLQLFLLGTATVVDTVLLLMILERVNRAQVPDWLYAVLGGLWLVHASSLAHELIRNTTFLPGVGRFCLVLTCVGLLLLPSGLVHASLWLNFRSASRSKVFWWLYLPLASLPWLIFRIVTVPASTFLELVRPASQLYLVWIAVVNVLLIVLFLRFPKRFPESNTRLFFPLLVFLLALLTIVAVGYYRVQGNPVWEPLCRLVLILAPILPALLFVWYTVNRNLLPLVVERTLLYGAFLVTMLFLHRLLLAPFAEFLEKRAKLDVLLVEAWALLALILLWPPLRGRFREAARYLMSSNVHQVRDATRRLSVELSHRASDSIPELLAWMTQVLKEALGIEEVSVWLDGLDHKQEVNGPSEPIGNTSGAEVELRQRTVDYRVLVNSFSTQQELWLERGAAPDDAVEATMQRLRAMWVFRLEYRAIRGVAVLGPRLRADRFTDEQLNALALLFEQFAATLHNRQLELLRLRAERMSMQQDKLSVLGLIAGSLAHELKNPLSSIRTLASLMLEDLGPSSHHSKDLHIIIAEIDRLCETTNRLLDYSRPAIDRPECISPDSVITRLLHILQQLARQKHVGLSTSLNCAELKVAASDAALGEIFFNLIKNAIEAASLQSDGQVVVSSHAAPKGICIVIRDNGPGIPSEIEATMFEPFVTAKADGTGLGLYVVAERIKELSGTIKHRYLPGEGTLFEIVIPTAANPAA